MMGFVLQVDVSALGVASNSGRLDVVKALIEAGANINHTTKVSTQIYSTYTCMIS